MRCSYGCVVVTGPIQGNGGKLGDGCSHLPIERRRASVRKALAIAKMQVLQCRETNLFEPSPGFLAVYPDYSAEGDGQYVEVPILGTDFEVL